MKAYGVMVNDCIDNEAEAIQTFKDWVASGSLAESEPIEQTIAHCKHIEDFENMELWYCYGADHYFIALNEGD